MFFFGMNGLMYIRLHVFVLMCIHLIFKKIDYNFTCSLNELHILMFNPADACRVLYFVQPCSCWSCLSVWFNLANAGHVLCSPLLKLVVTGSHQTDIQPGELCLINTGNSILHKHYTKKSPK